jgi:hypothetical protein
MPGDPTARRMRRKRCAAAPPESSSTRLEPNKSVGDINVVHRRVANIYVDFDAERLDFATHPLSPLISRSSVRAGRARRSSSLVTNALARRAL